MVDLPSQPLVMGPDRPSDSAGIALPATLTAMLAAGVLVAGMWTMVSIERMSTDNREDATRALQFAEAGVAHAQALLRGPLRDTALTRLLVGSDGVVNTSDDGWLTGFGLASQDAIPDVGIAVPGGRYFVQILDDPADADGNDKADSNGRVLARCWALTSDQGSASVDFVIGSTPLPGIVVDGSLKINGNPNIVGTCGSAHANEIVVVSGNPTIEGTVTASDTVEVSGSINDTQGDPVEPLHHQPPVEVPDVDPWDFCGEADYILQANGFILDVATSVLHDARSDEVMGWKRGSSDPVQWDLASNTVTDGTYCVEGNAKVSGNPGVPGNPAQVSLIATGSIELSGNPYIQPAHPDGALIVAGGDVSISGNPEGGNDNYHGLVYAAAQCKLSGNPSLFGNVVCRDGANPPGSMEFASENEISGNASIQYQCGGTLGARRRVLSWYQRFGT